MKLDPKHKFFLRRLTISFGVMGLTLFIIFISLIIFGGFDFLNKIKDVIPALITIYFLLTISILTIFKKSNRISSVKSSYLEINQFSKAIFFITITFLLLWIGSSIIPKIVSSDYYLVIDDLPTEFIEKGYSKVTLKKYIELRISNIKLSDLKESSFNISNDQNTIKLEAFGNSVYINEFILLLRSMVGNNKTINVQFGINDNKEIFYNAIVINRKNEILLPQKSVRINEVILEQNVAELTKVLTLNIFLFTHFRKVISYNRFSTDDIEALYDYINSREDISFLDRAYFYRVYGNSYFDQKKFGEADIYYKQSLSYHFFSEENDPDEYNKLVDSYCLNLHRMGRAQEALEFLNKLKDNPTTLAMKAYLQADLGNVEESKKLYFKVLHKKVSGEYRITNNEFVYTYLINLLQQGQDFAQAEKLAREAFEIYGNDYHRMELYNCLIYQSKFEEAEKLNNNVILFNAEEFLLMLNSKFNENTSIFQEPTPSFNEKSLIQFYYASDFLEQRFYPNSRLLVRQIINNNENKEFVHKTYSQYIERNFNDIQVKNEYLAFLLKNESLNNVENFIHNDIQDLQITELNLWNLFFLTMKKYTNPKEFSELSMNLTGNKRNWKQIFGNSDMGKFANLLLNNKINSGDYSVLDSINLRSPILKESIKLLHSHLLSNEINIDLDYLFITSNLPNTKFKRKTQDSLLHRIDVSIPPTPSCLTSSGFLDLFQNPNK